jgi:hypothetical protein
MREGRDWLLYTSESKPPTPIFLFYNRDDTRHGIITLYPTSSYMHMPRHPLHYAYQ